MELELRVGKLIVGNGKTLEGVYLGIQDGTITEISMEQLKRSYEKRIDASDRVVMPGLIDTHVHLVYSGKPQETDITNVSDEYLTLRAGELARRALRAGVTTIGDAGGRRNTIPALRDAIEDGVMLGPRIRASGTMITMTGGRATHGHRVIGGGFEINGADEARKATRELLMYYGANFIKLGATGALSSPHTGGRDPQLTVDEMRAAVEEAHKCGRPVHAHCYGEQGISNALEAGVDVIVHGQTLNNDHIRKMKQTGAILVPTLTVFREEERVSKLEESARAQEQKKIRRPTSSAGIYEETKPNFMNAMKQGITIAAGTDSGMTNTFCGQNPLELVYMVDWGMSENDAIVAGTLNSAKALKIENMVGTIEVGKYADLLVLNEDPLKDIEVITKPDTIEHIMLNGRLVEDQLRHT